MVSCIAILYIAFAEFTNLAYGNEMEDFELITTALPATSVMSYILKSLYTVNLICSYPLMITPAVSLLEGYMFGKGSKPSTKRYWMQNLFRTCIVAFTITFALLVYNYINYFLEIVSAATCSPLAFTLPALFHYKLKGKGKPQLFIAIFTTALTFFMIGQAIYEMSTS